MTYLVNVKVEIGPDANSLLVLHCDKICNVTILPG